MYSITAFPAQLASTTQEKLQQYKAKIRLLHAKRNKCLHGHQEQYFYPDVEDFLRNATGSQMRQYLHHYENAIALSIKAAETQPVCTIFTFPGFIRTPIASALHRLRRAPLSGSALLFTQISEDKRGTPSNRKHTRWRNLASTSSIRKFFRPKPS